MVPWLVRSWSVDAADLSLGFLVSVAPFLVALLAVPIRLSLEGEGRTMEVGRGNVVVGFGRADGGRGSLDSRGRPEALCAFCGVSSIARNSRRWANDSL